MTRMMMLKPTPRITISESTGRWDTVAGENANSAVANVNSTPLLMITRVDNAVSFRPMALTMPIQHGFAKSRARIGCQTPWVRHCWPERLEEPDKEDSMTRTWWLRQRLRAAAWLWAPINAPRPTSLARWVQVRATTRDGVIADLSVDFVVVGGEGDDLGAAEGVLDTAEDVVRRYVQACDVEDLPRAGDAAPWLDAVELDGAEIRHSVIGIATVEVSPELDRLVRAPRAGADLWS